MLPVSHDVISTLAYQQPGSHYSMPACNDLRPQHTLPRCHGEHKIVPADPTLQARRPQTRILVPLPETTCGGKHNRGSGVASCIECCRALVHPEARHQNQRRSVSSRNDRHMAISSTHFPRRGMGLAGSTAKTSSGSVSDALPKQLLRLDAKSGASKASEPCETGNTMAQL